MAQSASRPVALVAILLLVAACGGPSATTAPAIVTEPPSLPTATPDESKPATPAPSASPETAALGGSWEPGVAAPSRRAEHAAAAIDGVIYVPGGLDPSGNTLDTFEAFDTATETWSTLPPLPEPRDHFGLAELDGKLYLSGGSIFFSAAVREGLWVYDPAAASWTALAPMPGPRSQHGMAVADGKLYVVGGVGRGATERAVWAYDPASGEWQTNLPDLPTEREHLSVVESGGKVYAIGGRKGSNLGAVEAYDPATNSWETLAPMPTARGGMAAGVVDGLIHTAGGEDLQAISTYPQHEVFDPASVTWAAAPDLPTKRHGLASAVVDGRWYVIGGGRAAMLSTSDIVEVFTPGP